MTTLVNRTQTALTIVGVRFTDSMVCVELSDHREIGLPLGHPDLRWLTNATPEQRNKWSIVAKGRHILWDELNDGIEVEHLLKHQPLT
ncbi:MAG: DUF2442 domain-containing protein [Bacteroidota bacterium]